MKINEANISAKKGTAHYTEADINTPFVQSIIDEIVLKTGQDKLELINTIESQIVNALTNLEGPDSLYSESKKNVVESILFNMIPFEDTEFSEELFFYMFKVIIAKNKTFLQIKDRISGKRVHFNIILTPPSAAFIKQPDWVKGVTTAAASAKGDVVFNKNFAKQLIKYAELKGEKSKGSMYISNGGKVPDSYAYMEFLILHEIYHIIHADHFQQTRTPGMTPLMQNYLGDYITNYNLVKAGYPQLPIGLFSKDYNFDNFDTMVSMQEQLIKDFKEVTKDQKKDMNDQMDDHLDEDNKQTNGEGSEENDEPGEPGKDGSSDENGEPGEDGSSDEPGEPGEDGSSEENGEPGEDGSSDDKSLEDTFKDSDKDLSNADDAMSQDELAKAIQESDDERTQDDTERRDKINKDREESRENQKSMKDLEPTKSYSPINWKKIIKQMIPKETEIEEESLTKMHRRTRGALALDNDIVSVKAGKIKGSTSSQSLLFILDSSGSMSEIIDNISIDLLKLIDKNKSLGIKDVFIIRFDNSFSVYKIKLDMKGKKHTYNTLANGLDILKDTDKLKFSGSEKPIKALFSMSWGAGTEFPNEVVKISKALTKKNFNQVIFTDSDILQEKNIVNLGKLCKLGMKKPYSFNIILDSNFTYSAVKKTLGNYKYMSYIS